VRKPVKKNIYIYIIWTDSGDVGASHTNTPCIRWGAGEGIMGRRRHTRTHEEDKRMHLKSGGRAAQRSDTALDRRPKPTRRAARWLGEGSAAPDVERLHRREARQTGGERGGAAGADAVRTARERGEQMNQRKERAAGGGGCFYTITIIMRERRKEWAGAEQEGACPRPPPLRTNTAVPPTARPDIPAGNYS
jgi:hypothetical protein